MTPRYCADLPAHSQSAADGPVKLSQGAERAFYLSCTASRHRRHRKRADVTAAATAHATFEGLSSL